MHDNPYQSPVVEAETTGPSVAWLIYPPAIALLVLVVPTILNDMFMGFVVVIDIIRLAEAFGVVAGGMQMLPVALGLSLVLAAHLLVAVGAIGMLRRQGYRLAYAAAIISIIPVLSPGYVAGIPIGIWALWELRNPKVREAFAANNSK